MCIALGRSCITEISSKSEYITKLFGSCRWTYFSVFFFPGGGIVGMGVVIVQIVKISD